MQRRPRQLYPRVLRALASLGLLLATLPVPARATEGGAADPAPLSPDHPRVWPPVTLQRPLLLGAVDAYVVPDRAAEADVHWQRAVFDWSGIQPHSSNEWNVGSLTVDLARRERDAGRPIVGALMSAPSWATGTTDPRSPPRGLDLPLDDPGNVWAAWVSAVVSRYAEGVDTWVLWNEPDVWSDETSSRQWTGTPEQYAQLLKVGYLAAKRANPRATVLMAGLTYWWDQNYGREQYFQRVLRALAADPLAPANGWYFEGAVLQLYNDPRGLFDAPRTFHQIMRSFGFDKPVWINETNVVPWDDPAAPLSRAHYRATQDEQASYLVQAVAYALAGGSERVAVYKMLDDRPGPDGILQAFGLIRQDAARSTRPFFQTFQVLDHEFTQTARAQLVDADPLFYVYLEQPSLGRRLTVLWNTGPEPWRVAIAPLGGPVDLLDKAGNARPVQLAADGMLHLTVPRATANTLPGYPNAYFIGGDPLILREPLPRDYQPLQPTLDRLPPGALLPRGDAPEPLRERRGL